MRYVACLFALLGCGCRSRPAIIVFAASSLSEVAEEIGIEWTRRSGVAVRVQTASSSVLARQIREGALCDLFLSADADWVDFIRTVDRRTWLTNRLVLVVRADRPGDDVSTLALGGEGVPAGKYAKIALERSGRSVPSRVVYGANVRDVLQKVVVGAADGAIVYETDAAIDPGVRIVVHFAEPQAVYVAALLTSSGRALYEFLGDPWTAEAARRRGFHP